MGFFANLKALVLCFAPMDIMSPSPLPQPATTARQRLAARLRAAGNVVHRFFLPFIAGFLGAAFALVIAAVIAVLVWGSSSRINDAVSSSDADDGSVSHLADDEEDIVGVVEKVNPAVVSIVITKDVPKIETYYEQFGFFEVPRQRQYGVEEQEIGGGSGFLVSADGYIVTNRHVVQYDKADYTVFLNDGTDYRASVVATDDVLDLALLKIDANDLPYLEFGDSDATKVGQTVIAIGNALGEFRNTVSVGVVSGLSRSIIASSGYGQSELLQDVMQTDAAINQGNSGGPLLNTDGYVVGVNVAVAVGSENIGFALPANAVKIAVDSLRENGEVLRAYLGVHFTTITDDLVDRNNLDVDHGALIVRGDSRELAVVPGSPADKAGLEENDIILEIDGEIIDVDNPLNIALRDRVPGDEVRLKVLHDGKEKEVRVTLGTAPSNGS